MGGNENSLGSGGNVGSPGPCLKSRVQGPMLEASQAYTTGRIHYEQDLIPGVEEIIMRLDFRETGSVLNDGEETENG